MTQQVPPPHSGSKMPEWRTAEELRNVWHECTGIYRRSIAAQQQSILRVFRTGQSQRTFLGFVWLQWVVLLLHFVLVQQLLLVVLGAVATANGILTGLVALRLIWRIAGFVYSLHQKSSFS